MDAKDFFNLVSKYVAHRTAARKAYDAATTADEKKAVTKNYTAVLETIWGQIECEVRRVKQAQMLLYLKDEEGTLEGLQRISGHIAERLRINDCEREWLVRERNRILELIKRHAYGQADKNADQR